MLRSAICRREHFDSEWYARSAALIGIQPGVRRELNPPSYRKLWEWCAILEALHSRDMLRLGRRGLGFAVGSEPLPSALAARGVDVLATDLKADESGRWLGSGQNAGSLEALWHAGLVDEQGFRDRVRFQPADMRDLSAFPSETFDFVWSSCALEHVGTLEDGWKFVLEAMRLVKPGGVAVHTTEYNLSSNDETVSEQDCLYRKRDVEDLDRMLRPLRCGLAAMDWDCGTHFDDLDFDVPPYFQGTSPHIKLMLDGFISTSMLLVIHKA